MFSRLVPPLFLSLSSVFVKNSLVASFCSYVYSLCTRDLKLVVSLLLSSTYMLNVTSFFVHFLIFLEFTLEKTYFAVLLADLIKFLKTATHHCCFSLKTKDYFCSAVVKFTGTFPPFNSSRFCDTSCFLNLNTA